MGHTRIQLPLVATVAEPGSFWTAIASLVGIGVIAVVLDQLDASREATLQATRSADAYIESERGVIRIPDGEWVQDDTGVNFVYTIENFGKGLATILSVEIAFELLHLDSKRPLGLSEVNMELFDGVKFHLKHELKPDDVLITGNYKVNLLKIDRKININGLHVPIEAQMWRKYAGGGYFLAAKSRVTYRTLYGYIYDMRDCMLINTLKGFGFHPNEFRENRVDKV